MKQSTQWKVNLVLTDKSREAVKKVQEVERGKGNKMTLDETFEFIIKNKK